MLKQVSCGYVFFLNKCRRCLTASLQIYFLSDLFRDCRLCSHLVLLLWPGGLQGCLCSSCVLCQQRRPVRHGHFYPTACTPYWRQPEPLYLTAGTRHWTFRRFIYSSNEDIGPTLKLWCLDTCRLFIHVTSSYSLQVCAVHTLQALVRGSGLGVAILQFAPAVAILSLTLLSSPCWAMRNAALQLYSKTQTHLELYF